MSTATQREGRRRSQEAPFSGATAKPKRWRWRRRLAAVALVLTVSAVWLLPWIVAHSPLLPWALAAATAELNGTLTVRSASLGWFSPVVVEGIEVRDAQHEPVFQASQLKGSKSLAAMLLRPSKLGQFRLEQPELTVVLRGDGSNLEDLLAAYLQRSEGPDFELELKTVDGSVSLIDQDTRRTWQIEKLQLALSISADAAKGLNLETSATLPDPQQPGRLSLALSMRQEVPKDRPAAEGSSDAQPPGSSGSAGAGELTLQADAFPLAMVRSLVGRLLPQTELAGRLSCRIDTQWSNAGTLGKTAVRADVAGEDLMLATPSLGTDQVRLKHLHAACRITRQDDRLEIKDSSLDCDLGNASVTSTLKLDRQEAGSLLAAALCQTHEVTGRVNLARLAQMLPDTLRIRRGTQITSGQVQLALSSRPDPRGMVWQGRLEASDLRAVHQGRQLAWQRPILLALAAHDFHEGPVVDSLKCESDFLKLHASGTAEELTASASFDFKPLAEQLGQFVDLGGIGLGGDGWAQFHWKRSGQQDFEADGELQTRDFQLALPGRKAWSEESLIVSFAANGRTDFGTDTQLQAASLQVKAKADQVHARLTQPVLDVHAGGTWPVEVKISGQLQNWPPRIQTWIAADDWHLAGTYQADLEGVGSKDGLTIRRARLALGQLRLQTPSLNVAEPAVELLASGRWDHRQRQLRLDPLTLTCTSLSLEAKQVRLNVPEEGPPELASSAKYQADLQRVSRWITDPGTPPAWQLQGRLAGTAQLSQSGGTTEGRVDADVGNLLITLASGRQFRQPLVHLAARGKYEHRDAVLRLEKLLLTSDMFGADAAGRIARADGQTDVQLDGKIQYDLEKLAGLLQPYIGTGVRMDGKGTGPASYRGPLSLAKAGAHTAVSWKSAQVYGFPVGPGDLKAALAGGVVQVQPMDVAVSGGQARLAPRVRLAPDPMELTLPRGPLARQVRITPQMCDSALKYIAPVLADVTTARGAFSIELDGCRIPLADPAQGDVSGKFMIHSVEVGPGPLVRELAVLLGRVAPARLRRESVVPFRMVQGRVHHAGLELEFPDLTIRTSGSVGLDQTLDLTAEMPIPPKWLGNNPLGTALRGQKIQLPIAGTLSKPAINRRVMDRLSRQFIERGVRNVIEDELGKQLEGLFGPPQ